MVRETIDPDELSSVIGTIYDCAVDPQYWPTAIKSIAQLIDGDHGLILMIDTISNEPRLYVDWNVDPEVMRLYREEYHDGNPLNEGFARFGVDEPYNITAVIDPDEWMKTRVYTEFGEPRGWLDNVGVSILKTASRLASLSVIRPTEVGWAGPRELKILRLLSPHVRRAVSIADLIDMRSLAAASLESTLDGLAVPIVLVDDKGRIAHANASARALAAAGDPIVSERGVLRAAVPAAAGALEAAIAQTAQPEARMGKIGIDVPVPYADGRPGFAHVLPIGSGAAARRLRRARDRGDLPGAVGRAAAPAGRRLGGDLRLHAERDEDAGAAGRRPHRRRGRPHDGHRADHRAHARGQPDGEGRHHAASRAAPAGVTALAAGPRRVVALRRILNGWVRSLGG